MIKKGDKVICVNSAGWESALTGLFNAKNEDPKEGDVLTVLKTTVFEGNTYLYFEEINLLDEFGEKECYVSYCFRKIVTTKFTNDLTKQLANRPIVKEGIERIVIQEEEFLT
jgi:hypothetical protein